ncbi:hypothetical protein V6N13_045309 [Hibiscus sabdariffa]|uniref:Uncharacterized protein n=1 Tax=Hibiscus sabdariffa TaxID=183260 RepID=A0ABR2RL39_9ROSI
MDVKSKVIDISPFLLFEATGDSETGCSDPAISVDDNDDDDDDDDDAESCSCDTTPELLPGVRGLNGLKHKASVGDEEEEGEVVELQKEAGLHKNRRDGHRRFTGGVRKGKKSSSVSVDSAKHLKDKNRLFWEACLAS